MLFVCLFVLVFLGMIAKDDLKVWGGAVLKWSRLGQKVKVRSRIENVNLDHPKLLILLYFITYFYSFSLMVKVNR